jgi:hypothetical protein
LRVFATSSAFVLNSIALLARSDSQIVMISLPGVFVMYFSKIAVT